MAAISKPDLSLIWASAGDILKPSDSKIQTGWSPEIPPRQWFNWYQNRVDSALAHINQFGIPVWDAKTEYQANKSFVQGSDGNLYKAVTTTTNVNPVTDTSGAWSQPFVKAGQTPSTGTNFIRYSSGLVDQWASATGIVPTGVGSTADLIVTLPIRILSFSDVQVSHDLGSDAEAAEMAYSIYAKSIGTTLSTVTIRFRRVSGSNADGTETVKANVRVLGPAA